MVTLVSPLGEYGGPLRVAVNQAKALMILGHSVTIAGSYLGYASPPTQVEGVPVRLFRARQALPRVGHAGIVAPGLLSWLLRASERFDIAHIHMARDLVTLPAAHIANHLDLPYVVQTHGMIDESDRLLAKPLDRLLTRSALGSAYRVLYLTDVERRDLLSVVGHRQLTVEHLPNGVPNAVATPFRGDAPTEVLFLGRLASRKRPISFVQVAATLSPEFPGVRFTLVGPDDGEGPAVRRALDDARSCGTAVDWEGPIPPNEVVDRMQRSAIYVLPSIDEPYPMSVLEAMSVALPVVVTRSCGLADFIHSSNAGAVVDDDEQSLTHAVRRLLSNPLAARSLGERGREAVRADLSMSSIATRLERIYQGGLSGRPTSG